MLRSTTPPATRGSLQREMLTRADEERGVTVMSVLSHNESTSECSSPIRASRLEDSLAHWACHAGRFEVAEASAAEGSVQHAASAQRRQKGTRRRPCPGGATDGDSGRIVSRCGAGAAGCACRGSSHGVVAGVFSPTGTGPGDMAPVEPKPGSPPVVSRVRWPAVTVPSGSGFPP